MQHASPYRVEEAPLDRLIPPDRRRMHAAILAFCCLILGAVLLRGAEALLDHLDRVEPVPPPAPAVDVSHGRQLVLLAVTGMRPSAPRYLSDDLHTALRVFPEHSKLDQAREALLRNNPALAKELLMPTVASGRASPEEVRMLKAACDGLRDRACIDFLRGR